MNELFKNAFWGIIAALLLLTVVLLIFADRNSRPVDDSISRNGQLVDSIISEVDPENCEPELLVSISNAVEQGASEAIASIALGVDELFEPVYASIRPYTEFHYSVVGEYTELIAAAQNRIADEIETRLFAGFEQREDALNRALEQTITAAINRAVRADINANIPECIPHFTRENMAQLAIEDAVSRFKYTTPIASIAGVSTGKVLAKAISQTIVTKIAVKATAKGVAKAGGVGGSAAVGAGMGTLLGPVGSVVGGIIGGAVAWFAADAAIITIDQFWHQDDFEAELRTVIDGEKSNYKSAIASAYEEKKEVTLQEINEKVRRSEAASGTPAF